MVGIIAIVSGASVVGVKCPNCGEVQARARRPLETSIRCRACGKAFSQMEGRALYKKTCISSIGNRSTLR